MEGKESRINNNTDFVNDRISALPDFILGHILSFLPTEEAIATAFLSKRWKFVWVIVHNLEFYNCREQTEDENMKFARFVNRALLLHDAGWLNKFSLVWHPWPISSHVTSWINSAITKKVREVSVHLDEEFDDMPTSIFNCDSLQYLELTGTTFVYDATMVCLPRLESLKLNRVYFESEEACEKLVSGCPMLHYLKLYISFRDDSDDEDDDFTCIISSSSLRHLNIDFQYKSSLKLKASSLEFLEVSGGISEICVEKNLSSLIQAVFNIRVDEDDFPNNSIVEAVRAFNCAKVLTLSTDAMWALSRATISLSTEFKRLVKLEARTYFSSYKISFKAQTI